MKKEFELIISKYMGVAPIEINSALLSAQNRVRLYWTNIANEPYGLFGDMVCTIPQPKDKGILLRDILETDVAEKYYLSDKMLNHLSKRDNVKIKNQNDLSGTLTVNGEGKQGNNSTFIKISTEPSFIVASRGRNSENSAIQTEQQLEPRFDGKTNTLTSVQKDNLVMQINPSTQSGGKQPYQQNRVYDSNGISPALCANKADLIIKCTSGMQNNATTYENKSTPMTAAMGMGGGHTPIIHGKSIHRIRRLTPTECERLQTVPDGYTSCVSDSQRYRMLGNGWTVDVVAHILSFLNYHN
jgi:DNA (cytosine-5)-methyltransferase 3A